MNIHRFKWFKPVVAVLFGLAGFAVNLHAPQIYQEAGLKLNFFWGMVFPLAVALAWGWRFGLLSALAGGTLWVWWLWPEAGWGNVYSFSIFTLWMVWHGWWADHKRVNDRWFFSPFLVEAPFRVVASAGFLTLFVWLVSLNPPPWDAGATITTVGKDWIGILAVKHVFEGYFILLAAYAALGMGPVRKVFGLARVAAQRDVTTIFAAGILLAAALWFADNAAHFYAQHGPAKNLWDALAFHPTGPDLSTRVFYMAVLLAGTAAFAKFTRHRALLQGMLDHQNRVLLAIRNVNQLITRERDRDRLLDEACAMLVETRGYHNVWVALFANPLRVESPPPESPGIAATHHAGFGNGSFARMRTLLDAGTLPMCAGEALRKSGVHVVKEAPAECANCPFAREYQGRAGLVTRLESGGQIFGWLSASIPKEFAGDPQETGLMREIAGDLAFALEGIRIGETLDDTREREAAVVRAGRVGLWDWDLRTGRVFYSPEWKRQIGYEDDEIGDGFEEWQSRVHPDDLEATLAAIRSNIEQRSESYSVEFRFRHKNGSHRWILAQAAVTSPPGGEPTHVLGTHVDVTDIKRTEEALRQSQRDYRLLFEGMEEGFALHEIIPDADGKPVDYRYLSVNRAFEKMTGMCAADVVGRTAKEVFPDAGGPWSDFCGRVATTGKPDSIEAHSAQLGRDFAVSAFRPQPGQFAVVFTDVTERNLASRRIQKAMREAEAANHAKTMFLATMSHELRTPLTPILGFSEFVLGDENLTADQREAIETIHRRGNDLLRLINDLLNFSTLDAGEIRIHPEPVMVGELVADAVALFSGEADRKGLRMATSIDPRLGEPLLLDAPHMRQILQNLIANSVKFTTSGSVRISAKLADGTLLVAVTDTGEGITPADCARIFDLFYQADSSPTRRHGGAGLGLSICKRLVTLMGGEIRVESVPGHGSTFHVSIPAQIASTPAPPMPDTPEPPRRTTRILLAEDDETNARVTQKILERAGHTITHATNGCEALDLCEKQEFDLILMDLKMPVMDGLEAARQLRERGVNTPIVALTACAFDQDRVTCLASGMIDWISKPVDWKKLVAVIADLVTPPSPPPGDRT